MRNGRNEKMRNYLGRRILMTLVLISQSLIISFSQSQNWRDSLTILNKQIAQSAWSTDLHLRKANANLQLKQWRFDLSRNDLNDLLAFVPTHFEARLSLAVVLQQLGRKQEALDQLNQTIQLHADSAVAYAARANLERDMKQDEVALYDWQRAEELSPRDVTYVVSHVDLLLVLGRKTEARRVLDAAVKRGIARGMLTEWYGKVKRATP